MAAIEVTSATFEQEVLKADKPVIVDFWATWCGPCKMLSPLVAQVADENPDIKVCAVDVDENPELAQKFAVSAIPTLVAFKNGAMVNKSVGFVQKPQILALVK